MDRRPSERSTSPIVDIDTFDTREELPPQSVVDLLTIRKALAHHRRGVHSKFDPILRPEWCRAADHISAKADRVRPMKSEKVSADGVFDVNPPVEKLVIGRQQAANN